MSHISIIFVKIQSVTGLIRKNLQGMRVQYLRLFLKTLRREKKIKKRQYTYGVSVIIMYSYLVHHNSALRPAGSSRALPFRQYPMEKKLLIAACVLPRTAKGKEMFSKYENHLLNRHKRK